MSPFLRSTPMINWDHPEILALASYVSKQSPDLSELVARSFRFVRDHVLPDSEYQNATVTLKASDILINKQGCCFGRSHLLAALLRANGISAGFAYQKVPDPWNGSYRLHALNSVYIAHAGWFDLDTWGDDATEGRSCHLPGHQLAYPEAERVKGIWPNPMNCVVDALLNASHVRALYLGMPELNPNSELNLNNSGPSPSAEPYSQRQCNGVLR